MQRAYIYSSETGVLFLNLITNRFGSIVTLRSDISGCVPLGLVRPCHKFINLACLSYCLVSYQMSWGCSGRTANERPEIEPLWFDNRTFGLVFLAFFLLAWLDWALGSSFLKFWVTEPANGHNSIVFMGIADSHTHTHTRARAHTCTHAHSHTRTLAHTHTRTPNDMLRFLKQDALNLKCLLK